MGMQSRAKVRVRPFPLSAPNVRTEYRRKRQPDATIVAFPDRWGWYPAYREIPGIVLDTESPILLRRTAGARDRQTGRTMRLIAENLCGERGGRRVFSDIGFSLGAGEALVVTGANGAGKSTLLRVLAGLLPAASGRAIVEGGGEDFPTVASAAHYLGHLNAMKPVLSVAENLAFWRSFSGADAPIETALEAVGLCGIAHLPYGYLSTGQKRRAAIARLLVSRRPAWLLDEPTAGLDAESARQLSSLMVRHREEGGMIIAATHLPLGLERALELTMGGEDA
ncbi:heme ABC exporter ATP-binding protein CcmA [Mesorhizobium marinum]|uniref:heme ABC exporter ATP-binding protein CcmA n=1 Tax=Mesorhizobium marinum TaxID=3228790 RepID=UPI003F5C9E70